MLVLTTSDDRREPTIGQSRQSRPPGPAWIFAFLGLVLGFQILNRRQGVPLDDVNWPESKTRPDEVTALLIRARALVARGWCRRAAARNLLGLEVSPYSRHAVAWCADGALQAAQLAASNLEFRRAYLRLLAAMGDELVPAFNDRQTTVEPVLEAFDRAISRPKEETK